ncbi:MAG: UDP-N-acetylglucosamine 4,6-dehydratase (inverting) [Candidatus Portnoybacteria bacterium RIFCSPLOWO2_02_FULL_39_11]|uniref:UDP-N-acetylglucosamine 4,6-dehydratase (Inverting) n=1 Tax=Candidatus Portnoybacteria bacterium RIFCSPLOWO2_02_FULL_39_11 TaxID=1802001 RepID=A0A1G2FND3_9BACT|nr:MAG: UDP-N-acetylglucosamine 4,6-dehydratase (inverting) [Candidatus Portnoybacteria bacterium RIFCSPLOWO2_02_FULL_39_11]
MAHFLDNKTILITGGTGSFGQSFTKYLLDNFKVRKVIVFSRDELKQFNMQKEYYDKRLRFFLGDVRDLRRLQRAFNGVDIVVHAAALKQVPMLEYNPFEAVKTNILGSQNVIEAAIDQGVKKVLLISTDKAVQPINLYGSTKLCAEKLFISGNSYSPDKTFFSCVRYGNVIGSRGSIVEILLKNRDAKKVFITDERMTRFWISLEQSFKLVLFALETMAGGEIFIPKIPSMKLIELFEAIVPQAKKEIIGVRAGEKIHEVLLTADEARQAYDLGDYFAVLPASEATAGGRDKFKKIIKRGRKVAPDFCFASDNNKQRLRINDLRKIILE